MREVTDKSAIEELARALGQAARTPARVYLTGGATAVLFDWRPNTIDVDLKFVPDSDELLRALPILKERLHINIELAAPSDFVPTVPGWEERSIFICREGKLDFFHYDPYSQALSKLERAHVQDLDDVESMKVEKLIEPSKLLSFFETIESELYKYPAIDPKDFRQKVEKFCRK